MHRRDFFQWSAAALAAGYAIVPAEVAAALQSGSKSGKNPEGAAKPGIVGGPPVLQSPASDGVTVFQGVRGISTAWVEYGLTPRLDQRADTMRHGLLPLNGLVHRVRLEGLKPGTVYHYRVGVCPIDFRGAYKITRHPVEYTPIHTFRTLQPQDGRAGFFVINDTHENMDTLRGVGAQLAAARARQRKAGLPGDGPTIWNGDIFNDVRSDAQIGANILMPPIAEDTPGASLGYASSSPMCFVSGNHDVRGIHARSLDMFVDTPGGVRYSVIRHGPIAFIVLDTGEDKPDDRPGYAGLGAFEAYRDVQRAWLEQALKRPEVVQAAHRVVIQHIPMWQGGSCEDARVKWGPLLAKAGVTAMICGHTHRFAYTPAGDAQPFAQLVGGGPAPESATVIEGLAEGKQLSLIVRDLGGKELGNYLLKAPDRRS